MSTAGRQAWKFQRPPKMEGFFTGPSSCSVYSAVSALGLIVGIVHHCFFQYPRQAALLTVLYFCAVTNLIFLVGRIRSATSHWRVLVELALFNVAYVLFQLLWPTIRLRQRSVSKSSTMFTSAFETSQQNSPGQQPTLPTGTRVEAAIHTSISNTSTKPWVLCSSAGD